MSKIEEQVMGSVAVIYAVRALFGVTALKVYALILSLGGIVAFVSVPHVASNFVNATEGGVGSVVFFMVSAVVSTTLLVQLALMVGAVAALLLVVPAVFRTGDRSFA